MNEKFRVVIASDTDYEDLIAEIYFEDKIILLLTQEAGFKNLEIEIYPPANQHFWLFKFSEFEEVIQYAKRRLWELRRISDDKEIT